MVRAIQQVQGMFLQDGEYVKHEQIQQSHLGLAPSETSQLTTANTSGLVQVPRYLSTATEEFKGKNCMWATFSICQEVTLSKAQAFTGV